LTVFLKGSMTRAVELSSKMCVRSPKQNISKSLHWYSYWW